MADLNRRGNSGQGNRPGLLSVASNAWRTAVSTVASTISGQEVNEWNGRLFLSQLHAGNLQEARRMLQYYPTAQQPFQPHAPEVQRVANFVATLNESNELSNIANVVPLDIMNRLVLMGVKLNPQIAIAALFADANGMMDVAVSPPPLATPLSSNSAQQIAAVEAWRSKSQTCADWLNLLQSQMENGQNLGIFMPRIIACRSRWLFLPYHWVLTRAGNLYGDVQALFDMRRMDDITPGMIAASSPSSTQLTASMPRALPPEETTSFFAAMMAAYRDSLNMENWWPPSYMETLLSHYPFSLKNAIRFMAACNASYEEATHLLSSPVRPAQVHVSQWPDGGNIQSHMANDEVTFIGDYAASIGNAAMLDIVPAYNLAFAVYYRNSPWPRVRDWSIERQVFFAATSVNPDDRHRLLERVFPTLTLEEWTTVSRYLAKLASRRGEENVFAQADHLAVLTSDAILAADQMGRPATPETLAFLKSLVGAVILPRQTAIQQKQQLNQQLFSYFVSRASAPMIEATVGFVLGGGGAAPNRRQEALAELLDRQSMISREATIYSYAALLDLHARFQEIVLGDNPPIPQRVDQLKQLEALLVKMANIRVPGIDTYADEAFISRSKPLVKRADYMAMFYPRELETVNFTLPLPTLWHIGNVKVIRAVQLIPGDNNSAWQQVLATLDNLDDTTMTALINYLSETNIVKMLVDSFFGLHVLNELFLNGLSFNGSLAWAYLLDTQRVRHLAVSLALPLDMHVKDADNAVSVWKRNKNIYDEWMVVLAENPSRLNFNPRVNGLLLMPTLPSIQWQFYPFHQLLRVYGDIPVQGHNLIDLITEDADTGAPNLSLAVALRFRYGIPLEPIDRVQPLDLIGVLEYGAICGGGEQFVRAVVGSELWRSYGMSVTKISKEQRMRFAIIALPYGNISFVMTIGPLRLPLSANEKQLLIDKTRPDKRAEMRSKLTGSSSSTVASSSSSSRR